MTTGDVGRLSRRDYQRKIARHKRRIRRRRRARIRRVRTWRTIYTTRFWTRVLIFLVICLAITFWTKFAYVYDIPAVAQAGLGHIQSYVTVKSWWFGPTVFDLGKYQSYPIPDYAAPNPYAILLDNLGQYKTVVQVPHFIFVQRS